MPQPRSPSPVGVGQHRQGDGQLVELARRSLRSQAARHLLAVEMESGGVYRAARDRVPMLAIRVLSDIVGLSRSPAWTTFACQSAAAFARAFLQTTPLPVPSAE